MAVATWSTSLISVPTMPTASTAACVATWISATSRLISSVELAV
jgi:hypothetical protein